MELGAIVEMPAEAEDALPALGLLQAMWKTKSGAATMQVWPMPQHLWTMLQDQRTSHTLASHRELQADQGHVQRLPHSFSTGWVHHVQRGSCTSAGAGGRARSRHSAGRCCICTGALHDHPAADQVRPPRNTRTSALAELSIVCIWAEHRALITEAALRSSAWGV